MAVRIRLKRLGRRHRPFFRVCAMDSHRPRNGKVIEELGYYDPMVKETDARAVLNGQRIDYWLSVGALPTENVKTLIKKYGTNGTHLDEQKLAMQRLKIRPEAPPPIPVPKPKKEKAEEAERAKAAEAAEASAVPEVPEQPATAAESADTPAADDATPDSAEGKTTAD